MTRTTFECKGLGFRCFHGQPLETIEFEIEFIKGKQLFIINLYSHKSVNLELSVLEDVGLHERVQRAQDRLIIVDDYVLQHIRRKLMLAVSCHLHESVTVILRNQHCLVAVVGRHLPLVHCLLRMVLHRVDRIIASLS